MNTSIKYKVLVPLAILAFPSLVFSFNLISERIQYGVLGANSSFFDQLDIYVPLLNIIIPVAVAVLLRLFKISRHRLLIIIVVPTLLYTAVIFSWQFPYYPGCDSELVAEVDKGCAFAGAAAMGTVIHFLAGYGLLP